MRTPVPIHHITTPQLSIAYEAHGKVYGDPIILLHGFPYDPRAFDEVVPPLVARGYRVIVPYLRGYGATRFLSPDTMRSGQQAALAQDLIDMMDALGIPCAALAGYDWGGRAANIVAALWPARVRCLVTANGYSIHDIANAATPASPEAEYRLWYQYYFHTPRGAEGLTANRRALCNLLWGLWSPSWDFLPERFAHTAPSFDNPDFVDVVIHSYRHRFGYVPGDPALAAIEEALAAKPLIAVPTISLCGEDDGVTPPRQPDPDERYFSVSYERRILPRVGHNIPQEAPAEVADALLELLLATRQTS
ncbi:alpha/beta hydrolase [Pigmentiphaga aceris]|uniref:Alpha/beta hydrolase n=1 Tax=Pigmentiphaga aceris TaxID=1940612 RepID=A0A5C0B5L0_9BURK|nr:alpha/beta hydrolase [Pigmentiphaga aceris]